MDERIARLTTPKDARTFAKNAAERGRPDLETEALDHARTLQALQEGHTSPAQQAIATALYAYEEAQSQLKGRTFRANRTRQMIANRGALAAAERMVLNRRPSQGYEVLEEAGLQELSFEAIIVRFPNEFSSQAVRAAQARLDGLPSPPGSPPGDDDVEEIEPTSPAVFDDDALVFLDGFRDPDTWYRANWLPRYRTQTQAIAADLIAQQFDEPFEILWKSSHNDISNAGQGVLKYEAAEDMRPEFIQVLRDILADGSPANFEHLVKRLEDWKAQGRINKVPRLLLARSFAGIHPDRYHTTVNAESQDQVLTWFAEHTGFVLPRSTGWAHQAQALVRHLDRTGLFEDNLARNIFPWFVLDQLRARNTAPDRKDRHNPRPPEAYAHLPESDRIIQLRHNQVQTALFEQLEAEFGRGTVWTEYPTGTGGFADAYVRRADTRCNLYEIKIADAAAQVVRQAMGQLLEYGFREGGLEPVKLFAVGETALDDTTRRFLDRLRADFRLDIDYLQIVLPDET